MASNNAFGKRQEELALLALGEELLLLSANEVAS